MELIELVDWFEDNFSCIAGWPCAYTGEPPPPTAYTMGQTPEGTFRYTVFALRSPASEICHGQLVEQLHRAFAAKLEQYPEILHTRLYWRHPEKITIDTCEDFDNNTQQSYVYCRIAIPCLTDLSGLPVRQEMGPTKMIEGFV